MSKPSPASAMLYSGTMSDSARHMIIATFFFGLMQISVKFLAHLPTEAVVFCRGLVALVLCMISMRMKHVSPWGTHKRLLILRGVFGTAALFMFFYTLQRIPVASAVTIQLLSPVFTVLIASIFFRETANLAQWILLVLSFGGVLLIQGFDPRVPLSMALIGTASAFCSAIAYNTIRRIGDREDSMVVVFYFPLIATFVIGPFAISTWVEPSLIDWIWLLLTGVFVQAAQVFMTKAYALEKAANVVNYNYLGVVYGAVFGYVLFDEVITWPGFVGMSLIILSALVCARQVRAARV